MATNTLCREERLRGKRIIANLFAQGHSFFQTPYRVLWAEVELTRAYPVCFGVSVSKRRFKRAVKRNLLKRRTREVFRTNKQILSASVASGRQIHLMVIYGCDRLLPYEKLEASMKKILQVISQQCAV